MFQFGDALRKKPVKEFWNASYCLIPGTRKAKDRIEKADTATLFAFILSRYKIVRLTRKNKNPATFANEPGFIDLLSQLVEASASGIVQKPLAARHEGIHKYIPYETYGDNFVNASLS